MLPDKPSNAHMFLAEDPDDTVRVELTYDECWLIYECLFAAEAQGLPAWVPERKLASLIDQFMEIN